MLDNEGEIELDECIPLEPDVVEFSLSFPDAQGEFVGVYVLDELPGQLVDHLFY